MIYLAASVWLGVIVLLAWGVRRVWGSMIRVRVLNGILLPGTLVAQIGCVVGLLVSGAKARNVSLMGDDEDGEPRTDAEDETRIPLFGTLLVGLLPMLTVASAFSITLGSLGETLLPGISPERLAAELPRDVPAFWEQIRQLVTLTEETVEAVAALDWSSWTSALLVYLLICFTVRMAPLPGNARGHLGAIVLLGVVAALAGSAAPSLPDLVLAARPMAALMVGVLLGLLLLSLAFRGLVGLIEMLRT